MREQINSNKRAAFNHQRDYCPKALYRKSQFLCWLNIFVLECKVLEIRIFPSMSNLKLLNNRINNNFCYHGTWSNLIYSEFSFYQN